MGGRGAKLINPSRTQTRTRNGSITPSNYKEKRIDPNVTYEDVLGDKGMGITVGVAGMEVNPHFNEAIKYKVNCQRCVWAYEFQRRGYNVEALPNTSPDQYSRKSGIEQVAGRQFEDMGGTSADNTIFNIAYTMNGYGEGARGFVMCYWKGGGGHIFNVEQTKQGTVFVDAQTHKVCDIRGYMNRAMLDSVALMRTDDIKTDSISAGDLNNILFKKNKNLNHNK